MPTIIDTPAEVLFSPDKKNVSEWLNVLKSYKQDSDVKAEIKKYENILKELESKK